MSHLQSHQGRQTGLNIAFSQISQNTEQTLLEIILVWGKKCKKVKKKNIFLDMFIYWALFRLLVC